MISNSLAQVSANNKADNVQIKPKVLNEKSQPAIDEHAQLLINKADLDRIDETSVVLLLQAAREDEEEKPKLINESNSTSISSATLQKDLHNQNQMNNSFKNYLHRLIKSNDDNNTLVEASTTAGESTEEATALTNTGNSVFESAAGASFFSSSFTNSFPVDNLPSSERVLSSSSSPNELLPLAENQINSSVTVLNTS